MKNKLKHVVRFRVSDEQLELMPAKRLSSYIRAALVEKLARDFPDSFKCPF